MAIFVCSFSMYQFMLGDGVPRFLSHICAKKLHYSVYFEQYKFFFYRSLNFLQVIFNLKMCQWKIFFMEKVDQNPLKTSKNCVLIQNPRSHMEFVLWLILQRKVINFKFL